jgi:hypothetical protein
MSLSATPASQSSQPDKAQFPSGQPPRLWPAVLLIGVYWALWGAATLFVPGTSQQFLAIFWTPMLVAVGLLVWWFAFSRLPWPARIRREQTCSRRTVS